MNCLARPIGLLQLHCDSLNGNGVWQCKSECLCKIKSAVLQVHDRTSLLDFQAASAANAAKCADVWKRASQA